MPCGILLTVKDKIWILSRLVDPNSAKHTSGFPKTFLSINFKNCLGGFGQYQYGRSSNCSSRITGKFPCFLLLLDFWHLAHIDKATSDAAARTIAGYQRIGFSPKSLAVFSSGLPGRVHSGRHLEPCPNSFRDMEHPGMPFKACIHKDFIKAQLSAACLTDDEPGDHIAVG